MLLSALSACHMLWYLHLCAEAGVVVTEYVDDAVGTMIEVKERMAARKGRPSLRPCA